MRKSEYKSLADVYKTEIDTLKRDLFEAEMKLKELKKELDHRDSKFRCSEIAFENDMLLAKLKNDALVKAITSEDTSIFVYKGEIYNIKQLHFTKSVDTVDTLELELCKASPVIEYTGGLVGTLNKAIENVKNSLSVALYGDKNNKEG